MTSPSTTPASTPGTDGGDGVSEWKVECQAKNPLLLEVVLRKIFEYLPLGDLKSCRLVNSTWNSTTLAFFWQSCNYISFNNDNYWTNIPNHKIEDVRNFIGCISESGKNFSFVKIDIGTSVIEEADRDEKVIGELFESVSPHVSELTIRDERGQNLFSTNVPQTLNFPMLHKLTIHFVQTLTDDNENSNIFQFFSKIMGKAPVLDKLALIDHNGIDGRALSRFIEAIEKGKNYRFTSLHIAAEIEDAHLITLAKMGLKLKHLHLDFWGSFLTEPSLKVFLESQSNSLRFLRISDFAMSSNFVVDFPCLKNLETLTIKGSVLGQICVSFPEVSYKRHFPVLKRLCFTNAMHEWDDFLKFGIQPVETVEELKLPGDFADEVGLQEAARIFPRIKKLEISALLNIVSIVYESMPNVEELILNTRYVDLIDDILTGLSLSDCDAINTFSEEMFHKLERDHLNVAITKPISCLERLKILRLKCRRQSDPVELTDVACRLVLMKMKSLQCLDFWKRQPPPSRVSPHVLNEMREKFLVLC